MAKVSLKCSCGAVQGTANDITPSSGNRVICYCDDCQAFAEYLSATDKILDENGGTDIFQTTPSQIKINKGIEKVRCIRLSPNGMFRWYTECCQTPIGNTISAGGPFVGIIHNFMDDYNSRDENLGPVRGHIHVKFAKDSLPKRLRESGFPFRMIMRTISKMLVWKIRGLDKPSPFFDLDGNPVSQPNILEPMAKN